MAANTCDVYSITIEKGYGIGMNENYKIILNTPGAVYVGHTAKRILDFLNKGEVSRSEQGIDGMQDLYILYMAAASQRDNLEKENERLKEELAFVRDDNTKFGEDIKQVVNEKRKLEADLEESQRNNIELAADVKALVTENHKLRQENAGLDLENFVKDDLQKRYLKLQEENETLNKKFAISERLRKDTDHDWCELHDAYKELEKERDELKKRNEYLSGSIKTLCEMHTKEKAELKEQLETSSDLNMTDELACIMGEYVDGNQKNHNILVNKLAKFQEKHKLICVAGELKRG